MAQSNVVTNTTTTRVCLSRMVARDARRCGIGYRWRHRPQRAIGHTEVAAAGLPYIRFPTVHRSPPRETGRLRVHCLVVVPWVGCASKVYVLSAGEDVESEVAAPLCPSVVSLGQDGTVELQDVVHHVEGLEPGVSVGVLAVSWACPSV
jgi:hypothetical protein